MRGGEVAGNPLCLPAPVSTTSTTVNVISAYPNARKHLFNSCLECLYGSPRREVGCGHEAAGRPFLAMNRSAGEVTPAFMDIYQGYATCVWCSSSGSGKQQQRCGSSPWELSWRQANAGHSHRAGVGNAARSAKVVRRCALHEDICGTESLWWRGSLLKEEVGVVLVWEL
jgi:hypothetical protein